MSLNRISNSELQKIGLNATIQFFKTMSMDKLETEEVIAVVADIYDPILNLVLNTQATEENIQATICSVKSFYEKYRKEWSWVIGPLSRPVSLAQHLTSNGLTLTEKFPSFYFDLSREFSPILIENFIIKEADEEDDLTNWAKPLSKAFSSSDHAEGFRNLNASLPHGSTNNLKHFMGYCNEIPICCGTLFLTNNAVMIHNMGTDPAYSRKGFGTAMTAHLMLIAKQLGFEHCFLDATENGVEMYKKLGFYIYAENCIYSPK